MSYSHIVLLSVLLIGCTNAANSGKFPPHFLFGTASSAYQVEGAWNLSGKGENVWDHATHTNPSIVKNRDNADVASDFYHKHEEDVARMAEMGLTHYRFSIAWSRILPTAQPDNINSLGIMFYQSLLEELKNYNIEPIVTMYHWDLPQSLHEFGGWLNTTIVENFANYARVLFANFPEVKYWATINEPQQVCPGSYGYAYLAPFMNKSGTADYQCIYNVLKSHAAAYHIYKKEFPQLKGKITIVLDSSWSIPRTNESKDKEAAERRNQFMFGMYAHPIYFGDWPDVVKERVKMRSELEHLNKSRLPEFTEEEIANITGTTDYMALNYYESRLVSDVDESADYSKISYEKDMRVQISDDPNWEKGHDGKTVVPSGFKQLLKWIKETYNNPDIIITQNGIADDGTLNDTNRMYFIADHLNVLLDVMEEDNITIFGYTVWSLCDTFEWTAGFTEKFGLYSVDFQSDNRTRTPKASVQFYKNIATNKEIPHLQPRPIIITTTSSAATTTTMATPTTATTTATTTTKISTKNSEPTSSITVFSTTTRPRRRTTANFYSTTVLQSSAYKSTYLAFSSTLIMMLNLLPK